jgi:hypothetical protein
MRITKGRAAKGILLQNEEPFLPFLISQIAASCTVLVLLVVTWVSALLLFGQCFVYP